MVDGGQRDLEEERCEDMEVGETQRRMLAGLSKVNMAPLGFALYPSRPFPLPC